MPAPGQLFRIPASDSIAAASGRFGKYKKEDSKLILQPEIRADPTLERLLTGWTLLEPCVDNSDAVYDDACKLVKGIRYSPDDVRRFAVAIETFQGLRAAYGEDQNINGDPGLFISALINEGANRSYAIPTTHLSMRLDFLGWENRKTLIVEGDCSHFLGCGNQGRIIVKGSVGGNAGDSMRGGSIRIEGDAGRSLGEWMSGGIIHVMGSYDSLGAIESGKIYHGSKLIFK